MTPVEIAGSLRFRTTNRWSGILLLDAKYLNKRMVLLLAIDYGTVDIVAWKIAEAETEENYRDLIDMVEECGYVIGAIVSDGEPSILALTQPKKLPFKRKGTRRYPRPGITPVTVKQPRLLGIPHQWCVIHAERDLKRALVKVPVDDHRKQLEEYIHAILFAKTLAKARKAKESLLAEPAMQTVVYRWVASWIMSRWEILMLHHTLRVNGKKIPRDTNAIENVVSYLNTRLKTMRRIRNKASAEVICNLIVVNYRCKPLQNTKNKLKRGKCPLALASGQKRKFDWMEFIKKSCS